MSPTAIGAVSHVHELVGRTGVRRPTLQERIVRTAERRRQGRRQRSDRDRHERDPRADVPLTAPGARFGDGPAYGLDVAAPGAATSLALNAAEGAPDVGADTGIRFTVPDAEAEHAAMRERGVSVGDVMRWDGVSPMYTFRDPDGNRFYVVEESR